MPDQQPPIISLIIPCFNCGSFIRQTLESVAAQNMGGINGLETLIVDDDSTDNSVAVISQFLDSHPDFRGTLLRHPTNAGVAVARNTGIQAATGQFLMFLDADDTLAPDCCQRLLELQSQTHADIVACNALHLKQNNRQSIVYPQAQGRHILPGRSLPEHPDCHAICESSCGKLYRRELIISHNLLFQPGLEFGEDTLFTHTVILTSPLVAVDFNYCGYLYKDNQASCVNTAKLQKRLVSLEQVLLGLSKVIGTGCSPLLLRKSCEFLWTLRKFGCGQERLQRLKTLLASPLWLDIIHPTITAYGKPKHRLYAWLLRHHCLQVIRFW